MSINTIHGRQRDIKYESDIFDWAIDELRYFANAKLVYSPIYVVDVDHHDDRQVSFITYIRDEEADKPMSANIYQLSQIEVKQSWFSSKREPEEIIAMAILIERQEKTNQLKQYIGETI